MYTCIIHVLICVLIHPCVSIYTQAVKAGNNTAWQIRQALRRVMRTRFKLGLFDPPSSVPLSNATLSDVRSPAAIRQARDLAQAGADETLNPKSYTLNPTPHTLHRNTPGT